MGSRKTVDGVEKVYTAASTWVERALKADDSLFNQGTPVWSKALLGELRERFLDRPDVGSGGFYDKLRQQLEGSPPEVYQLMAEALYAQFLIIGREGMRGATKQAQIEQVLGWGAPVRTIPEHLVGGLTPGIASSMAFALYRPYQVAFIIEFVEQWKELPADNRERLLQDPWAFKEFVENVSFRGQLLRDHPNAPSAQREALLHLVHPDHFEGTVSVQQKESIAGATAFAHFLTEDTPDVDRKLAQIRRGLEAELGFDFDLYDRDVGGIDIRAKWDPEVDPWDEFVRQAQRYVDSGALEADELDYKREIAQDLSTARDAVLAGESNWHDLLKRALRSRPGHPIAWQLLDDFNRWCTEHPVDALRALQSLWEGSHVSVEDPIRAFTAVLPNSALRGAVGSSANVISVLLMALDVESYPPFRLRVFDRAYERIGYGKPAPNADEATVYEHALGFLDRFIDEARERGLELQHRLDAQSVVWQIAADVVEEPPPPPPPPPLLESLAAELHLPVDFLSDIEQLLLDKKQVIFQGPPGTGKTYVARKLASCLAGSPDQVALVQLHPSYAYEDFVQGYRPIMTGGQSGFARVDGPLLRAARLARAQPNEKHFLVIDEINRGNVAKVFGELYFLLEYRDESIRLQYQDEEDEPFSLPENLYIIGTMNTADRSIALVDLALRRRFYFVDFHPDEEPVKSVLRGWLRKNAPEMEWVADVVECANERLRDDRHAAIGPSYFMKDGLGDEVVRRVWRHSVLPYIEERFFGDADRLDEFDLDKLRPPKAPGSVEDTSGVDGNGGDDAVRNDGAGVW